jgi:hypothetical protein
VRRNACRQASTACDHEAKDGDKETRDAYHAAAADVRTISALVIDPTRCLY